MAVGKGSLDRSRHNGSATVAEAPLKVTVKNFGPVSTGTVIMRPLTVLIGPSNSGKSYVAKLAYRINRSCQIMCGVGAPVEPFLLPSGHAGANSNDYKKITLKLQDLIRKGSHKRKIALPSNLLLQIQRAVATDLPKILASELRDEFGGDIDTLRRFSTSGFSASISGPLRVSLNWSKTLAATCKATKKTSYGVVQDPLTRAVVLTSTSNGVLETFPLNERSFVVAEPGVHVPLVALNLARAIVGRTVRSFLNSLETQFFFLLSQPILKSFLPATKNDHDASRRLMPKATSEASLNGLPDNFMNTIMSIDPNKPGPLFDLAKSMEREMLGGNISVSKPHGRGIPTISLEIGNNIVALQRMSSHASSLALLTLYLKFVIEPGQRIIIEGPEAHMSPANQLLFAKYVVFLIRRGVRVTIVTHSVLIFEQLSAYMVLGGLGKKDRKSVVAEPDAYLNLDEVSAHQFHVKTPGNCTIEDIPRSRSGGIDQEQFGRLSFEMYDERSRIQEKLEELTDDTE